MTVAVGDVHGNLAALIDLLGQLGDELRERDVLVFANGHWNNAVVDQEGWPRPKVESNTIGIDTIAHGVLTAIRMPARRLFQSARYAATRPAV